MENASGVSVGDLFQLNLAEWLLPEKLYCRDIGFIGPVHRKQHLVHAKRHHRAPERSGRKVSATGDHKILSQVLRRSPLEASTCGCEMSLVVDPMEHERQTLA